MSHQASGAINVTLPSSAVEKLNEMAGGIAAVRRVWQNRPALAASYLAIDEER